MINIVFYAIFVAIIFHQYFTIRELKREKGILETDLYAARGDIKKSQSMLEKEWRLLSTEKSRRNTPVTDSGTLTDTSSSKKKKEKQKDKFSSSSSSSSIWHSRLDDYSISSGLPSSSSSSSSSGSSSSSSSSDSYSGGGGSFSGSGSGGSWSDSSDSSSSSSSGGFD